MKTFRYMYHLQAGHQALLLSLMPGDIRWLFRKNVMPSYRRLWRVLGHKERTHLQFKAKLLALRPRIPFILPNLSHIVRAFGWKSCTKTVSQPKQLMQNCCQKHFIHEPSD